MKKAILLFGCVIVMIVLLASFAERGFGTLTGHHSYLGGEHNGKGYKKVKIGSQTWMVSNLDVVKFNNGDSIPQAKTSADWEKAGKENKPAWCYYDNDPANGTKYGLLYNWYAVNDSRGLAPKGWHIPNDKEWTILEEFLGEFGGTKMKSTADWKNKGTGTNESGFTGLPGGARNNRGTFYSLGSFGYWWTSTELYSSIAWTRYLSTNYGNVYRNFDMKSYGFSVRCVKN